MSPGQACSPTADPAIYFDRGPDGHACAFRAPRRLIVAESPAGAEDALEELAREQADGHWVAGYASYELGHVLMPGLAQSTHAGCDTPLLAFGVFDHPRAGAPPANGTARLSRPEPLWDREAHAEAFTRVHDLIGAGEAYQVNLTFAMRARWEGEPGALYATLAERQPVGHGAFVDFGAGPPILSRSPELFFRTGADGVIEALPMKGTIARGLTPGEDVARRKWLRDDIKNRAENLMIVDLLRNDLGRIAEIGSVDVPELFSVQTYATVHQMVSRVRARLKPGVRLPDILRALFPCGSVTGAPKHRAMLIIRELESFPRAIYCGTVGWMGPDGRSCFNVAIRTLSLLADGEARLNVGGGIVWDSTAPSEYEEALLKSRYARLPQNG